MYLEDGQGKRYEFTGESVITDASDNDIVLKDFETSYYDKPKELYLVIKQPNFGQ
ncbi:hypothetical protein [Paenibacillus hamazuiensis]|uniref:hypothetical protein n=1 Tax=Paenibacillus hamazuiensis TaxID=2936508 RepID=UPI00200E2D71|nr:hypothetical protein [Paenibacillus hamazuiensis]